MEFKVNFKQATETVVEIDIRHFLIALRTKIGMSRYQTNKMLGRRTDLVWQYETLKHNIWLKNWLKICALYEVEIIIIIKEEEFHFKPNLTSDFDNLSKQMVQLLFDWNREICNGIFGKKGSLFGKKLDIIDNTTLLTFLRLAKNIEARLELKTN